MTADKITLTPAAKVMVVGVRFRHSKTLWFDPCGLEPEPGDMLIVTTERGTEMGECVQSPWEVAEAELPAPLKPVVRIADDEDLCRDKEHQDEEIAAIPVFREFIENNKLDMKPADVELLFGREKMIFYFSAEERIDFRQLVRDLASHFHIRIEMRQVGVRDEARMAGGIAHCGEVLCCSRLGGEFAPVSIKMAKDQGLPLNPTKISGVCGRLMCCLRYEAEAYKDFNKRSPKKGAIIDTPRGGGKVIERDVLRESLKLSFRPIEGENKPGETMNVPLARMCCKDKNTGEYTDLDGSSGCKGCPCAIRPEVFEELVEESKQAKNVSLSTDGLDFRGLSSTQGTDSAVDNGPEPAQAPKRGKSGGARPSSEGGKGGKKGRRRRGRGRGKGPKPDGAGASGNAQGSSDTQGKKPQQRRSKSRSNRGRGQQGGQGGGQTGGQNKGQRGSGSKQGSQGSSPRVETRVPRRRSS